LHNRLSFWCLRVVLYACLPIVARIFRLLYRILAIPWQCLGLADRYFVGMKSSSDLVQLQLINIIIIIIIKISSITCYDVYYRQHYIFCSLLYVELCYAVYYRQHDVFCNLLSVPWYVILCATVMREHGFTLGAYNQCLTVNNQTLHSKQSAFKINVICIFKVLFRKARLRPLYLTNIRRRKQSCHTAEPFLLPIQSRALLQANSSHLSPAELKRVVTSSPCQEWVFASFSSAYLCQKFQYVRFLIYISCMQRQDTCKIFPLITLP